MVTEKMIEALKSCPFCGGKPNDEIENNGAGSYWIVCDNTRDACGCEGPYQQSEEDAVSAWNRRAEAALSTDAEPVAYLATHEEHGDQFFSAKNADKLARHYSANRWSFTPLYAAPPAPSVAVKLTDDEKHIGVIRSSVETGAEGKPDSRVSVKEWKDNDDLITVSMFIGNHRWVEGNFTPMDAAKIASLIATKPAVSALSAQVQDVAVPGGWKKIPERYSNYPWSVERRADGWHLNNHDFSATSRFVGVHATAEKAMAAAPVAKQEER